MRFRLIGFTWLRLSSFDSIDQLDWVPLLVQPITSIDFNWFYSRPLHSNKFWVSILISSANCVDLQRCETLQRCGFSQRFLDASCNFSQRCDLKCAIVNANYDDQFSQIEAKLSKISHIWTKFDNAKAAEFCNVADLCNLPNCYISNELT